MKWRWLWLWLFLVSGAIWLTILLSFLLFPAFVRLDSLTSVSGLSAHTLYVNYVKLMAYLHLPWITQLHLPDFAVSVHGAHHFADVKRLFLLDIVICLVTAPVALRFLAHLRATRTRWHLVRPFEIGAVAPLVLGGLMSINFDAVFIGFHKLMFRNNDWLFDPTADPIILVLPEDFFLACFALALLAFEALMVYGIVTGRRDARNTKNV
ncbi:TIGR01906 family membrane protein [Lacticaseibacillus daqingensis]|uniref:TIGR01906 family membrane protein n=1 Tax=Lacticaseibacillus daqingensis TaxID=2486014 RepID=UPI000F77DA8E|nr:TIGR01906 family membrane protein [Lacticaseibacillus daqingensis]